MLPFLLFSSICLHCSWKKAFLPLHAVFWDFAVSWVKLSLSPLLSACLLFEKPPQTTTFPSCISFSLLWLSWLPHVWYYGPLSIFCQALCLLGLIP